MPEILPVLFNTLAGVGYTKCEHPRRTLSRSMAAVRCDDCGAACHDGQTWEGGSLHFQRAPVVVS